MRTALPAFFKKRSVIVTAVVIVVLAVTVVTDLPANSTIASQISEDKAVIQQVNADVGPCAYAAHESIYDIYDGEQAHSLTAADIAEVPGLLRDDQTACSFTSDAIYELTSDVDVPDSASGKPLTAMLGTVTLWATSDALSAIESIQTLYDDPSDKQALSQLQSAERLLASDRAEVESEMEAADKVVGTKLPGIDLPALPDPGSTPGS
jgi:hypothetical protein